jgi:hypothetical protein
VERQIERPVFTAFGSRTKKSWLIIFVCFVYFAFCLWMYTASVEPLYGTIEPPTIEADSGAYFRMAGLDDPNGVDQGSLVSFGGSSLGPVVTALIFRSQFGVACGDCLLFLATIWWAGLIPGVRREYFAILMAIEPQTIPTLTTLNKEVFAIAGLVSFAAYIYSGQPKGRRRGSKWLLLVCFVCSVFARWEQIVVPLWYIAAESRLSPLRGRPRRAVVALLLCCSAAWAGAVNVLHLNLGGFINQAEGGGTITRLYHIQEKGGYFLVAFPKILMNMLGRLAAPGYFLHDYWTDDFLHSWQNAYLGFLSCLVMSAVVGWTFLRGRFRLSRPLIHLAVIYFIFTSINPFVQHRYIYPGYALIALELARRKEFLEPVRPVPLPPALPPSYRLWEHGNAPGAVRALLQANSEQH